MDLLLFLADLFRPLVVTATLVVAAMGERDIPHTTDQNGQSHATVAQLQHPASMACGALPSVAPVSEPVGRLDARWWLITSASITWTTEQSRLAAIPVAEVVGH
jgi:hypothetical protein